MNADERRSSLDRTTRQVIRCVYRVSNTLGAGFLEKVYENALVIELRRSGLFIEQQYPVRVLYDDLPVGEFALDLLVDNGVIVELKATKALDEIHFAQCMNYLKAAGLKVCLLVNFGTPRVQIKRLVRNY